MSGDQEVDAYSSGTTAKHFEKIDDAFVAKALSMGVNSGVVLDVGTGPGQIPIKMARLNSGMEIIGIDLSEAMLAKAEQDAKREGLYPRVSFRRGDGKVIPFDRNTFDLVISNSALHHIHEPIQFFNELERVTRKDGAILIRDLRRPSKLAYRIHVSFFGRHYSGLMRSLYEDSVRAAYTYDELKDLIEKSNLSHVRVGRVGCSHLIVERSRK